MLKRRLMMLAIFGAAFLFITVNDARAATYSCTCDNGLITFATNITGGVATWQDCNKSCIANGHQRYNFNKQGYENITSSAVTPLQLCINSGGTELTAGRCTGCEKNGKVTGAGAGSVCQTKEERDASQNSISPAADAYQYDNVTSTTATGNGQITDYTIPGQKGPDSELVKCGRAGGRMCTLCDLIAGLNYVIRYIQKIAIGVGLLAFTIAGVMYIVSAGDSGMTGKAKTTMKNAAIGFVIIFAGWVIINTAIMSIGTRVTTDANGNTTSMFGMHVTGWGQFDCTAASR